MLVLCIDQQYKWNNIIFPSFIIDTTSGEILKHFKFDYLKEIVEFIKDNNDEFSSIVLDISHHHIEIIKDDLLRRYNINFSYTKPSNFEIKYMRDNKLTLLGLYNYILRNDFSAGLANFKP